MNALSCCFKLILSLLSILQVNYRESLSRAADVRYIHKKQSGGSGQFADVQIRFEPGEPGSGFEFVSEIKGGAVPKEFIPGVVKVDSPGHAARLGLEDEAAVWAELVFKWSERLLWAEALHHAFIWTVCRSVCNLERRATPCGEMCPGVICLHEITPQSILNAPASAAPGSHLAVELFSARQVQQPSWRVGQSLWD